MSIENEIKLALRADGAGAASAFLVELTGMPGRPLSLSNIYFDTPDLALARSRSALRLRHTADGWLQTFKSGGHAQGGLHSRHEWELPVAGAALELDALLQACEADGIQAAASALRAAAPRLGALFRTDFTRTLWQVHSPNAEIEVALDQGTVIAELDDTPDANAGGKSSGKSSDKSSEKRHTAPLHELELELKRGDVAALHALARRLMAHVPGLVPDDISKAERGYALLGYADRAPAAARTPSQATLFDAPASSLQPKQRLETQFSALPTAWRDHLAPFVQSPEYERLCRFIDGERAAGKVVYPNDVFRALRLTAPQDVKVVILGQDPYHGEDHGIPQAHGLAFSVPPEVRPPPSLRNIFKEITANFGYPAPSYGCLDYWAKQGVLLLNTVLTVERGHAASHAKHGWEACTDRLLIQLSAQHEGLIFLLWGAHAQAKRALLHGHGHTVLESVHPSPLSAHRGFLGCRHFALANERLAQLKRQPIDWRLPDTPYGK